MDPLSTNKTLQFLRGDGIDIIWPKPRITNVQPPNFVAIHRRCRNGAWWSHSEVDNVLHQAPHPTVHLIRRETRRSWEYLGNLYTVTSRGCGDRRTKMQGRVEQEWI